MKGPSKETARELVRFGFEDDTWLTLLQRTESRGPLGRVGRFDLLEEVGRGGQSIVFRAADTRSNQLVAVKRLLGGADASSAARIRFEREAEISSRLEHSAIAPILESFHEKSSSYLVMRWVEGVPITEWAASEEKPATREEILDRIARVADGLRHAHQRGVIHRDLKPANILVDAEGAPHLLDFGLGKIHEEGNVGLTKTGLFAGTPAYASPEQIRNGVLHLDVRSDIYSLGVIAYELLTGQLPYDLSGNMLDNLRKILDEEPRPPRQADASIDRDLEAILLRALAKDPGDRYQSADAFLQDLRRYRKGDTVEAKSPTAWERLVHGVRRNPLPVVIAGVLFLLLAGFGTTMTVLYQKAEREAERAKKIQAFLESTLAPPGAASRAQEIRLTDILASLSDRIESEIDDPAIEADLRKRLAEMYVRLWRWEEAGPEAMHAVELHTELGSSAVVLSELLNIIGLSRTFQSEEDGIGYMERSLAVLETSTESVPVRSFAAARGGLAFALWRSGRVEDAEIEYRKAFALYDEATAADSPVSVSQAGLFYHYGAMLTTEHRGDEAEAAFQRALAIYATLPAELDIHRLMCMDDYGRMLVRMGRYDDAEPYLLDALAVRPDGMIDARLGYTHWSVAKIAAERAEWDRARESIGAGAVALLRFHENAKADGSKELRERILEDGIDAGSFREFAARMEELDQDMAGIIPDLETELAAALARRPATTSSPRASSALPENAPSRDRKDAPR
ncbi:MAG: serine/threonine protein kinase [Gemmatimonadetes bacterium]|nr:serine/threonine protein kinase [Gemmatimonadota bacterium]